jgi:hypothetical protein
MDMSAKRSSSDRADEQFAVIGCKVEASGKLGRSESRFEGNPKNDVIEIVPLAWDVNTERQAAQKVVEEDLTGNGPRRARRGFEELSRHFYLLSAR